jgi:hypothetical protein
LKSTRTSLRAHSFTGKEDSIMATEVTQPFVSGANFPWTPWLMAAYEK